MYIISYRTIAKEGKNRNIIDILKEEINEII
jgi:hypothetical protein